MPQPYPHGELVIVIDCADLDRSAAFWIDVMLQRAPDVKGQKNRLHLDLRAPDLDAEVRRVLGLGAMLLTSEPVTEDGWLWHILADPDRNEFCVLQPPGISSA